MKKKSILIITFFSFVFGFSQNRKIEKIYNDCYFNSMPENGREVKNLYKNYETLLISKKILKNNSGTSYFNLFKKVMSGEFIDNKTNFSLIDSINNLKYSNLIHFNTKCTEKIKSLSEYKKSNTYLLEQRMDSIKQDFSAEKATQIFLKTFNEKDFEIDYYKLRVLLLIERTNSLRKLKGEIPKYSKERINNSLKINLSKGNIISINGTETSKIEFKRIIENYLIENKKESLININTSRDAQYGEYIKLIENLNSVIEQIKNKISLEFYNKEYKSLTKTEKEKIEKEYSFEIYNNEAE
ncbi:hypothetical protein [uncultured Polaribacter sp.]|uniref:hypothetical protein n=1 Tax=uncultured Polaribacter sp. TaxID=174711 RepID=UPI00261FA45B|nr:hypothetical protein [uncultured Polaribacter sp.]